MNGRKGKTQEELPGFSPLLMKSTLVHGGINLFVITKEYKGKRVSSVEHNDPFSQMRVLAGMITDISADPRFSIRIEVKPVTIGGNGPALESGKTALSPATGL